MELIPAIDLRRGRAVRLFQGDDARATVYPDSPLALLAAWARAGVARIHVVDLDAALGEPPQREMIGAMAAATSSAAAERKALRATAGGPAKPMESSSLAAPRLQVGGGLRDRESIVAVLAAGCERAVVGSLAARDPDLFAALAREHPGRLVPALDVRVGAVAVAGWRESATRSLDEICGLLAGLPCPAVLVTDIERDGALAGPNIDLARYVARRSGLPALLSGGVRSLADLEEAAAVPEIAGAVVGRALYEERFTVEQALAVLAGSGADTPKLASSYIS